MAARDLGLGEPVCDEPIEFGVDHLQRLGDVVGRGARVDGEKPASSKLALYENTEYASPRVSRISWKSRDDIPPPSTWLTTVSA